MYHSWMMGRKSGLVAISIRWLSVTASLLIVQSPRYSVDVFKSSQTHHWLFSLRLQPGERSIDCGCSRKYPRVLFSSIADNSIGGIRSMPSELYNKLASRHHHIAKQISQPDSFIRPTEEWFHIYLSLSNSEQKRMCARLTNGISCIRRLGRHRLHEWLAFFLSDMVGLDHDQLRKMIVSRPQLLSYKLSKVQSTTSYFREELGFSSNEFASLLQAYPAVLMYSIDKRLRPTVDFLQNECGGGKDNWVSWERVYTLYPRVFSYSPEKTLHPKVNFLCNGDDEKSLGLNRSELSQVNNMEPSLWERKVILRPLTC